MFIPLVLAAAAAALVGATPSPTPITDAGANPSFIKRASCTFPSPPKTSSLSAPITVKAGTTFDGGNVRYDRGSGACNGQAEGGDADTVFLVESGATLQNVVIGKDQSEGIHCLGPCNIYNVWWEDVCEDAITIKQSSGTSNIVGGGAKAASDKVVQHNGGGTVNINHFCVQTAGKLYRSCGNCSSQTKRIVNISNSIVSSTSSLAGINSNYGDIATIYVDTMTLSSVSSRCDTYQGNNSGAEPTKLTSNTANSYCIFKTGSYAGPGGAGSTSNPPGSSSTTKSTTSSGGTGCTTPKYGQCGGIGFTGCTTCASGSTCTYSNDWYSQCV